MLTRSKTVSLNDQDSRIARESGQFLTPLLAQNSRARFAVRTPDNQVTDVCLPLPVVNLLLEALRETGQGNSVTLTSVRRELTTQQAADMLMVSRPYLIEELLERGKIPFRMVGNRRRIRLADIVEYQQAEEMEIARRESVMHELIAETDQLGLY